MKIIKIIVKRIMRVLLSVWCVLAVWHGVFKGKIFLCNFSGSIPGFFFLAIPALFLLFEVFQKTRKPVALLAAGISLAAGTLQMDFNFPASPLSVPKQEQGDKVRIMNWNTDCWDQYNDKDAFYAYLRKQDADIYILQEYLYAREWQNEDTDLTKVFSIYSGDPFFPLNYLYIDDTRRIREEFAGFYFTTQAQFATISRFPIKSSYVDSSEQYMATDIDIRGRVVRFFNVHILLHIEPVNPLTPYFYKALEVRFKTRQLAFNHLKRDIAETKTDYLIAGDFNSTRAMGVMDDFLVEHEDAVRYSGDLIPFTFDYSGLKLWRFDYIMVHKGNRNMEIESYKNINHEKLSDHYAQYLILNIAKG